MTTTHLDREGRTLCGRVTERFTRHETINPLSAITCDLCRLAAPHFNGGMTAIRVETCDICGTGRVTGREFFDIEDRFDPTRLIRWHAWTACDLHGHSVWDFREFTARLRQAINGLTDAEYSVARGALSE